MMETHTVNALLDPALRRGTFFSALTYVNGLVAPAFLFCAGLGFAIFLSRKNEDIVSLGGGFRSYLKKCLFILLLGYSLHVPYFSFTRMLEAGTEAWTGLLQVDVLQVIGVTLIVLLITAVIARSARSRIASVLALTAAVLLWGYRYPDGPGGLSAGIPAWLLAYVSRDLSPLFTIVPWAGFLTTGFLAGTYFAGAAASGREKHAIRLFSLISAGLVVIAPAVSVFTKSLYAAVHYWYWSAEYFLLRLGSVGLIMCGLWFLLRKGDGPGSRVLEVFGRESLSVYYIHLIIVYGKDFDWSFVRLIPAGADYGLCAGLSVLLTGAMYVFGRSWSAAKRAYPRATALAVRGLVAGSVLSFLLS